MSKIIARTAEGFLINRQDWTRDSAHQYAQEQRLTLEPLHWAVIEFVRDFFEHYEYSPIQRIIVKHLQTIDPTASSISLTKLFPAGPRQICLIAGLPKPARCV